MANVGTHYLDDAASRKQTQIRMVGRIGQSGSMAFLDIDGWRVGVAAHELRALGCLWAQSLEVVKAMTDKPTDKWMQKAADVVSPKLGLGVQLAIARALEATDKAAREEERERLPAWLLELAEKYPLGTQMVSPVDDLDGEVVGYYRTREGKTGLDLQQNGKRIVHVYQTKWWEQPAAIRKGTE